MESNQRHGAVWDTRYRDAGDDYLFGTEPAAFLARREALFSAGESAFLVGDGDGRNSVWLAQRGLVVTAIDISAVASTKARALATSRDVDVALAVGDVTQPEWPPTALHDRFDWVLGVFIQFVGGAKRIKQFEAIKKLTRPSGRVLLHGYTPKQLDYKTGGPSLVENLYTKQMLLEEFADWKIEELIEYEEDLSEGIRHNGKSALIGMVARKP
jgi:SAM-dependent methyltransferase